MTETEKKALALLQDCGFHGGYIDRKWNENYETLCRAIEQHEAFRQEVSDAVIAFMMDKPGLSGEGITRFIIAKPDPLVEALNDCGVDRFESWAGQLRAAIEKRGGKIVWGEG